MFCSKCGAANAEAAAFCKSCGAKIEVAKDIGQDAGMRLLLPVGRSGLAIAAGYLGLFSLCGFPGPFAVGISIWAIVDIRRHPEKHGMGRAIFGLVMGLLGTAGLMAIALSR